MMVSGIENNVEAWLDLLSEGRGQCETPITLSVSVVRVQPR